MKVSELIEHLKTLDPDLPVWLAISDDSERCYQPVEKEDFTIEEVCTWKEIDDQNHFPAAVIANRRYLP
jgi:hypothetical protein